MRIVWSLPVRGERLLSSSRGDLVRARYLIDALRRDGHEVFVVEDAAPAGARAVFSTYRSVLRPRLPRRPALVLRDIGRGVHGVLHGLRVAAIARRVRAELIVETQVAYALSGALATRLTHIPLVLDDCSPSAEEAALGAGLPGLARTILSIQARCARSVVAVSSTLAEMLAAEGIPRKKLVWVPNGVCVEAFEHASGEPWRSEQGPHGRCVVGFIGSFQPWHRVDLLIQAVSELSDDARIHVLLGGNGPGLDAALRTAAASRLRQVTALGAVPADSIASVLAGCDIGVLPHSNDYGDPMKLREYAAAGIPSVAPDLPTVREVVEHNATGLLFRPGDVGELAQALLRLASDARLRRRLGAEARRRALGSGSWQDRAHALVGAASGGPRSSVCRAPLGGAAPIDAAGRAGQRS